MSEPTEIAMMQMEANLNKSFEYGVSFRFKLPKKGLSLRRASIQDDVLKLSFTAAASINSPTITEEDVAIMARLVEENKRPEFFYIGIPPGHPFFGRQFKHYSPGWLRGTSVGVLLEKVDWVMKCLSIGAKTNDSRTKFWAAKKSSKLKGKLGTGMDFKSQKESGSIKMSCKSVKVKESSDELEFVGEPIMQIIDDTSSAYSEYATKVWDYVAYYDEPLYLKMRELIKLIVAMEYLKQQGATFNKEWYMHHTSGVNRSASQAIEVQDSEIPEINFEEVVEQMPAECDKVLEVEKIAKTGLCVKKKDDPEMTLSMSIKDHDILYRGMNPKEPIANGVVPDVESWSELYGETVPWPHVWRYPFGSNGIAAGLGGISTSHIPKTYVPAKKPSKNKARVAEDVRQKHQYESSNESISVCSSTIPSALVKKPPKDMIPPSKPRPPPLRNVTPNTRESQMRRANAKVGFQEMHGYKDEGSIQMFNSDGEKVFQHESLKLVAHQGGENGTEFRSFAHIPLPPKSMKEKDTSKCALTSGACPVPIDSGIESSQSQSQSTIVPPSDAGTMDAGDSGCFSPDDSGVDTPRRFAFCSPIGSDDDMD